MQQKLGAPNWKTLDMILTLGLSMMFVFVLTVVSAVLTHYKLGKIDITLITQLFLYVVTPLLAWNFFFRKYKFSLRALFSKLNFGLLGVLIIVNSLVGLVILYQQKAGALILIGALLKMTTYTPKIAIVPLLESVILAPLVEEFLFRGVGQTFLTKKMPFVLALLVTSITFGSIHIGFYGAFFTSLLSGYMYYKTKNLTNSILLHASNNLIAYLIPFTPATFSSIAVFMGGFIPLIPLLEKSPWELIFNILN